MSELIIDLRDAGEIGLAGGKAANLQRLLAAGFTVPEGFVITTAAPATLTSEQTAEILQRFESLAAPQVAVRSSGVSEDGQQASWAGQFASFLEVDRAGLLEAIKNCRQSVDSARVTSYQQQTGLAPTDLAVIVQAMVPGEVSGVAFSSNPVTGNQQEVVVEAATGLGESVVSGTVTPDQYIVTKSGAIAQKQLVDTQLLSDEQLDLLTDTIIKIETLFGSPQDVEWALSKDQFYILQSRPITTLA